MAEYAEQTPLAHLEKACMKVQQRLLAVTAALVALVALVAMMALAAPAVAQQPADTI